MRGGSGSQYTARLAERLGNVTILERPLHPVTLISAARSAVRARGRQRQTELLFAEIHRANERLRESERRFRSMADSAPALIWVTDGSGRAVFINRYYEAFFGKPTDEMLGSGWQQIIHHDDLPRFLSVMSEALAEQQPSGWKPGSSIVAARCAGCAAMRCRACRTARSSALSAAIST